MATTRQGVVRPTGQLFQIFGAEVKPVPIGTTGIVGTDIFETEQAGLKALEERTKQEGTLEGAEQTTAANLREIQRQGKLDIGLTRRTQATKLQEEIESRNRALQAQQRKSSIAGIEARTATGIGATPSTGAGIVAVSKDVSAQRLAILDRQRKLQSLQREGVQRRFEEATKEAKVESAKALQLELKTIDKAVAGITEESAFIEQARTDADKVIQTLIDTEGALANLNDQAINKLAEGSTLPLAAILSLRQLDKDRLEASQIKDSVDRLAKLSEIAARESRILNESKTASQKDIEFLQLLEEEGADQSVIDAFKVRAGITAKPETAKERAARLKLEAQTSQIKGQITPTSSQRTIDISAIGTGEPLPLGTIAPLGQMSRADKHLNPIANKAYPITIQRLIEAGLVQGRDFDFGETTEGIDTDSVATIMYSTAELGVRGAIATLGAGSIGSWYTSEKYGGSGKIRNKLSELSGKNVTDVNAQQVFNSLTTEAQTDVIKEIYAHEGGNQLFAEPVVTKKVPKFKTVAQGDAFNFATRTLDSNQTLMELEGVDFENNSDDFLIEANLGIFETGLGLPTISLPILGDVINFESLLPNVVLSDKEQKFKQASRNFLNAVLRKESGAAISESEFKEGRQQYFPQPGDGVAVRKQKRANRERVIKNFFAESGNAEFQEIELQKLGVERATKVLRNRFDNTIDKDAAKLRGEGKLTGEDIPILIKPPQPKTTNSSPTNG